jgi:hypothetical protein
VTGARTGAASVPVRFSWAVATDPSSAIAGYQFAIQVDGGAWSSPIGLAAGTRSYTRSLAIGALYAARVRARDRAGNWSPWAVSPTGSIGQISENSRAVAYRGTWNRYSVTSAIGGGTRYATARGASARVTVTRRVAAIIAPKGPTRGSAAVYVNGVYRATISLYAKTSTARNVVYVASFATSATRTVELRVLGTAGHPRVDIDGVVVLR